MAENNHSVHVEPTPGRIVLYKLSNADAEAINKRRSDWTRYLDKQRSFGTSSNPNTEIGYQAHTGNTVREDDVYPMVVVRVNGSGDSLSVNGQVLLDGNDTFWATSRKQGDANGQWQWPARV